jgi:sterol 3beta-glucosyltransferase
MRMGLQTRGSDRDVRPVIALAAALVRVGHTVEVVATSVDDTRYEGLCERLRVPFRAVPQRVGATLADVARRAGRDSRRMLGLMMEVAYHPFLRAMNEASVELCSRSDVVVGHFMMWQLKAAALKAGVRHVGFVPWPGMVPSKVRGPFGLPELPGLGRLEWKVVQLALDLMLGSLVRAAYTEHGVPAPRHVLPDAIFSDHLNLLAASPALGPAPSDWGDVHQVCGAFNLPEAGEPWVPRGDLREFLSHGEVVFWSLGSSEQVAPERARELLTQAARQSGLRCLI